MTTQFSRDGANFFPMDMDSINLSPKLPAATYTVAVSQTRGFFFSQIENFVMPAKLYGETERYASRIMTTYEDRSGMSTGAILAGEKGSGKSLLAKKLSLMGIGMGLPTIVVNAPYHGDSFFQFLQNAGPAVVLFDEFEKVYDDTDKQTSLLTLFDGTFPSHKLFVMTCNDKYRLNSYVRNRPGRAYYMLDFTGISADFIREYCADNLINKAHTESVVRFASIFAEFNFDMLKALIEEMNRYNESPKEALQMLNVKPAYDEGGEYEATLFRDGIKADKTDLRGRISPLKAEDIEVYGWFPKKTEQAVKAKPKGSSSFDDLMADFAAPAMKGAPVSHSTHDYVHFEFTSDDLANYDSKEEVFTFVNEESKLELRRARPKHFDFAY